MTSHRTYWVLSSKEGYASLSIDHPAGRQSLWMPVHPEQAVDDALELMEPAFAHYTSHWRKIMVPDPDETDARGFFVESRRLPSRVADPANAQAFYDLAVAAADDEIVERWINPSGARVFWWDQDILLGNEDDFCVPANELDIPPFVGPD